MKNMKTLMFLLHWRSWTFAMATIRSQEECSGKLSDIYKNELLPKMPGEGTGLYVVPPPEVLRDFELIVTDMMADPYLCDTIPLRSLTGKYEIGTLFEDHDRYCMLVSNSMDFPWGTVIVNQDPQARNLSLDCVHPIFDGNTAELSIAVFQKTNARSMLLSGSHRYANAAQMYCGGPHAVSDAAHSLANCFFHAARAIRNYYDKNDYTSIQFHGMGSETCVGVDAFLSHGVAVPPVPDEKILILRDVLRQSPLNSSTFNVPGEEPPCKLLATKNLEGRMINSFDKDTDVCNDENGVATAYTGRFIHIETKPWMRELDESLWDAWSDALIMAYEYFPFATPPRTQDQRNFRPTFN